MDQAADERAQWTGNTGAEYDAITEWGIPDPTRLQRLTGITQPVLITAGDNDTMIPTVNAWLMAVPGRPARWFSR